MMQKSGHSGSFRVVLKWGLNMGVLNITLYGKSTVFL